jgi:putative spermidine/putrescine transport system permease protein
MRRGIWAWLWLGAGALYFVVPLAATLQFSLQARRGELSLQAYQNVLASPAFAASFMFSLQTAVVTIVASALLLIPTAYIIHVAAPRLRTVIDVIVVLPFVIPPVVLVFGLARTYVRTPLTDSHLGLHVLLVAGYIVLSLPYMYRSIDTGMRVIAVRQLAEAAQSLGAGAWLIMTRIIMPNIVPSLISGGFITFAIVMGEFTIAALLAQPAFGPYMSLLASSKVYEPSALTVISLLLTWGSIVIIQLLGRRAGGVGRTGGA